MGRENLLVGRLLTTFNRLRTEHGRMPYRVDLAPDQYWQLQCEANLLDGMTETLYSSWAAERINLHGVPCCRRTGIEPGIVRVYTSLHA